MSRACEICGRKLTSLIQTKVDLTNQRELNYINRAVNPEGKIGLCVGCFDLFFRGQYDELEVLIGIKLYKGEGDGRPKD